MKADINFWRELKQQRNNMTKQQYRTIKGQAVKVILSIILDTILKKLKAEPE